MNKKTFYQCKLWFRTLLRSEISRVLKSKTKVPSKIRKAQLVSQGPLKMIKRKPKPMNG